MNVTLAFQLLKNMGLRYTLYRIKHLVQTKAGILKQKHPTNPPKKHFISLAQWKKIPSNFFFESRETIKQIPSANVALQEKTTKILQGEIQFFSSDWVTLGLSYDWITNPDTNYSYDVTKHWSEIQDFNPKNGDIKYVWEKSRFSYLLTIIRNDFHNQEDHSAFVFHEIENWIDKNPINQGPNWKCSQEISLRIFNWLYALHFYKNSEYLTENLWNKMQHTIYWQLHHVYHHIDFSRIAVRNNHAITETLALALSNILFPFIPETKKWSNIGKKYFQQEIDYQIYTDGSFIQHSMNYHRVLIQLLNFGLTVSEKAQQPFPKKTYDKAYQTLNFLVQFVQNENGYLPNYGANDGALFFPLSETDYRDYRPQLNTLHKILTQKPIFDTYEEDFFENQKSQFSFDTIVQKQGITTFETGYFLIREQDFFTFIRCASYKDRPTQADNLHIDFCHNGQNILTDAGSYKYNTTPEIINFFSGTQSHNTVMIGKHNQMLKGSRFIWYYWTKALETKISETEEAYIFEGKIKAFQQISNQITHTRKITKPKNKPELIIEDWIENAPETCVQVWNINPNCKIKFTANEDAQIINPNSFDSFISNEYGKKESQKGMKFEFTERIKTKIEF